MRRPVQVAMHVSMRNCAAAVRIRHFPPSGFSVLIRIAVDGYVQIIKFSL